MSTEYPKESQVMQSKKGALSSPQPYPYSSFPALQYTKKPDQINEKSNDQKTQISKAFSIFSFKF